MKKIIKIILVACFAFVVMNLLPLIAYVGITGSNKMPIWWGTTLTVCLCVIALCAMGLIWFERSAIKKEILEIINS